MPITIGSQTDVPSTGDPIVSPWYQDTARKLVHTFDTAAARNAWTSPPEGAMSYTRDTDQLWLYKAATWIELLDAQSGVAFYDARYDPRYVNTTGNEAMTGELTAGSLYANVYVRAGGDPLASAIGAQLQGSTGRIFSMVNNVGVAASNLVANRGGSGGAADSGAQFAAFQRIGTVVGTISLTASLAGVAYNTSSDRRLKIDLGPVVDALARVRALVPHHYAWTTNPDFIEDGLFADEVAAVADFAVTGEPDAVDDDDNIIPQQLDYSKLVTLLVAAVQDLADRVDALEGTTP